MYVIEALTNCANVLVPFPLVTAENIPSTPMYTRMYGVRMYLIEFEYYHVTQVLEQA